MDTDRIGYTMCTRWTVLEYPKNVSLGSLRKKITGQTFPKMSGDRSMTLGLILRRLMMIISIIRWRNNYFHCVICISTLAIKMTTHSMAKTKKSLEIAQNISKRKYCKLGRENK